MIQSFDGDNYWEGPSGVREGEVVHCRVPIDSPPYQFYATLCKKEGAAWSWTDPRSFLKEPNRCPECEAHPDFELHLLGEL